MMNIDYKLKAIKYKHKYYSLLNNDYKRIRGGDNIDNKYLLISKKNKEKLLEYQIPHTDKLLEILRNNITALDASDTGTGKTYVAAAICSQLKLRPIIICPKTIISNWKKVMGEFGVNVFMVINYETARIGKFYDQKGKRKISPHIQINKVPGFKRYKYVWDIPDDVMFIFDEAHKAKNYGTMNSELLVSAFKTGKKLLMLSATIADAPQKFNLFGYVLKFAESMDNLDLDISILNKMSDKEKQELEAKKDIYEKHSLSGIHNWIMRSMNPVMAIHSMLYPRRASRMSIRDLGDLFPETQISAVPYNMGQKQTDLIEKEYQKIALELDKLKDKKFADRYNNPLTIMLRAHQKIELLKSATIIELAKDYLDDGYSICVFVNFKQTIEVLKKSFKTDCIIVGGQSLKERQANIDLFQSNKSRIIICNIKAGGIGISLHDIHGDHPRISLISPSWDATSLVQTLGRVHRAGGKTKSLQRIIYCANTIEEKIADVLSRKLDNLSQINDGDVDPTSFFPKRK